MAPGDHISLPGDIMWSYLAEGAANIVYRIFTRPATPMESSLKWYGPGTPPPTEIDYLTPWHLKPFDGKLLRLRKDLPTTVPCEVSHDNWLSLIAPLFPDDQLINQTLVELRPSKIIEKLNDELKMWERPPGVRGSLKELDVRPTKRNGVYLADDEHGLLVTDMTASGIEEEVLEFKPKWLLQSPSAPKGSIRCRQCARMAKRNADSARSGEPPYQYGFCPLDLISKDPDTLDMVAWQILNPKTDESRVRKVAEWLKSTTLLTNLRDMQKIMDRKGVMEADVTDKNFLVAMTLRDCSIFLRLPDDDELPFEARIGDLDLKSPAKKEYWKSIEQPLIEEGWYMGMEKEEDRQPIVCALYPRRWDSESPESPPKTTRSLEDSFETLFL